MSCIFSISCNLIISSTPHKRKLNTPSIDPKHVFTGKFAPEDEMDPTECAVIEGDGMLHSSRFSNGNAIYCSRFVKTYKYLVEKEVGAPIIPQFLSEFYELEDVFRFVIISLWRGLIGKMDLKHGIGTSNTSVSFFANKILALGESDLPYIVNVTEEDDFETIKRWDFNGVEQKDIPVTYSTKNQTFVHDFAITKRFTIFPESQFVFRPFKKMLGRGMALNVDRNKVPRLEIINRHANSSDEHIVKWFEVPGFNALHVVNAWELCGEDAIIFVAANYFTLEQVFNAIDKVQYTLEKLKINLET
ncbi:hypothetical protein ACFE04_016965 [Oxalis oulophora]